jgi:hypothetical protein
MALYRWPSIPAGYTGEAPGVEEAFDGPVDFRSWRDSGNLDAPDHLPAGSTTNRNWDELVVARIFVREGA